MKIGHIELFVKDPRKSSEFYTEKLGFELVADQNNFMWVKLGEIEILLRPGKPKSSESYENSSTGIVIYTDDVKRSQKELESRGIVFLGFDQTTSCLTFKDPDGHWFQLVNPQHD